jgi:uncharacterized protein DUF5672
MTEKNLSTVAVVVPTYRNRFDPDEKISQRHLLRFLGKFDKYLVAPDSLEIELEGFEVRRFRDEFFRNTVTYSALLLSPEFYQAFNNYSFILIYQLDALVFSDQLMEWCERGWDYIGAPWIKSADADFVDDSTVGNGGFSLRKVESFLRVIDSEHFDAERERYQGALNGEVMPLARDRSLTIPERIAGRIARLASRGGTPPAPQSSQSSPLYGINEDYFWSFKAIKYWPGFKIAPVEEALRFSFEVAPRQCFALNNFQLPFGCHAWNRYDRKFWEPFLLK